jgi:MFS family permease
LFTFLTPIAAGVSLSALLITRVLVGMGEVASFPGVYNLLGRWIPKQEKSRAAAVNLTGIPLGTIFALSTTGLLVSAYCWQSVFYVFGGLGLVFAVIWLKVIHDRPSEHPKISVAERELLAGLENTEAEDKEPIPWVFFLNTRPYGRCLSTIFAPTGRFTCFSPGYPVISATYRGCRLPGPACSPSAPGSASLWPATYRRWLPIDG